MCSYSSFVTCRFSHIRCGEFLSIFIGCWCWSFVRWWMFVNYWRFLRIISDRITTLIWMLGRWFIIRTMSMWIRWWNGTSTRPGWLIMHFLKNTKTLYIFSIEIFLLLDRHRFSCHVIRFDAMHWYISVHHLVSLNWCNQTIEMNLIQ